MEDTNDPAGRFSRHFGTNYAPTEKDVEELRAILRGSDCQIRALDEAIAQKESELEELRGRRTAIMEATRNHRTLLARIRRIPQDLLQDIFVACLPEDRNPTMSADEAPMLLTRISSHWRQVAHLTPRLWASIYIPVPSVPGQWVDQTQLSREATQDLINQRIEGVKEWIQRSRACPLSIRIYECAGNGGISLERFLTECLIPVCGRWKDLTLMGDTQSFYPLQQLAATELPYLKSLCISFHRSGSMWWGNPPPASADSTSFWKANGLLGSELLTSLKILSGSISFESRSAWGGHDFPTVDFVKAALRQALVLRNLTLRARSSGLSQEESKGEEPPIELPFLTHLDVNEQPGFSLLPLLRTPSVVSVTYHGSGNTLRPSPLFQFLNMNIGANVEELYTDNKAVPNEQILDCLRLCPALRRLCLGDGRNAWTMSAGYEPIDAIANELFSPLAHSTPLKVEEVLCPLLEDIDFIQETNLSEMAVIDFIKAKQGSRDPCLRKLRNIKVTFGRKRREGEDMMSTIAPYVDAGLKATFVYRHATYRSRVSLYDGLPTNFIWGLA
ncbi:hypothetical protein NLJ89_g5280 [Agrocybe chaxingu]|uniref:F-box domain-containing protein n=1 Tax=Agrocybe chaxingu TaxID=84603 RepID=A0A9W8MTR3_9AGAR|nr:hypothetical protein NLJ89_g5280 [Agrocybe chaxingu]